MHLYILTRGQKDKVDRLISDLQAQYFTYTCDPHTKKPHMIQLGVRPIQLWELAFPKEHLAEICRTLELQTDTWKTNSNCPSKIRWAMEKMCSVVRKILKMKEVPAYEAKGFKRIINYKDVVDIRGVGIKEDSNFKVEMI